MSESLAFACGSTLARTVVICLLAWPIMVRVERWVRRLPDRGRFTAWLLILAPFLFPEMLVGQAYRSVTLSAPRWSEFLCSSLLLIRVVPVGVVTLLISPVSMVSDSAIYCRWLVWRANPWSPGELCQVARCYWYGPIRRSLPALGLMALVSLQEFELAALLQTSSWTDWFIAAQRVGLEQSEMLRQSVWPALMQLPLLIAITIWLIGRPTATAESSEAVTRHDSFGTSFFVLTYLALALTCGCLFPFCSICWKLTGGLVQLAGQPLQLRELGSETLIATAVSLCAGMTAWFAGGCGRNFSRATASSNPLKKGADPLECPERVRPLFQRAARQVLLPLLLLPGLTGSLLLSLSFVMLFQQPGLHSFYDTPVPWVCALIVWLFPRAVLLQLWVDAVTPGESLHLVKMLVGGEAGLISGTKEQSLHRRPAAHHTALLFRLRDQPQLLAAGLLCYWAYQDLSTAYLLQPSGLNSGLVRLYGFMHFGRFAALSAQSFVFFGTPVLVLMLVLLGLRGLSHYRSFASFRTGNKIVP